MLFMNMMLSDKLNLNILRKICSGQGLDVNLRYLSSVLNKHRETVRRRVLELQERKIIDRPIFPFIELYREYPVFVIAYADLPDDENVVRWVKTDKHVFGAFKVREGDYNMMLFEFHRSLDDYMRWRDRLTIEGKIPERAGRTPSSAIYVSNQLVFKYEPNSAIKLIEREFEEKGKVTLNDQVIDEVSLKILSMLVNGKGIRVNENLLARELGIHRATVKKRIGKMVEAGIILEPLCRFPAFFVPPDYLLVFSLVEVKSKKEEVEKRILADPHVSLAYRISQGRYNLLLFETHKSIEEYLIWEDEYVKRFPGCFGSIKNNYLTPKMTISIDQQKVSLGAIENRLNSMNR